MPKRVKHTLSDEEALELYTLEYVLTWNYTDNYEKDTARFVELSDKKYGTNEELRTLERVRNPNYKRTPK